jgi:predicted DsbA family dithiol-disulfide isomerase
VGKNNLLKALSDLEQEGITFDTKYSRGPFFLHGSQKEIEADKAKYGLPPDADNLAVFQAKNPHDWQVKTFWFDNFLKESGMSPRNKDVTDHRIGTTTMHAHRLAQYAATESNEKGELMWIALSRRWFMGKDTEIRPIRLDSREMLLECAAYAGLNMENANRVLDGEIISDADIHGEVGKVHAAGIHSIPQLVFEVDGLADGNWLTAPDSKYRFVHGGSGSKDSMKACLMKLHQSAMKQACGMESSNKGRFSFTRNPKMVK